MPAAVKASKPIAGGPAELGRLQDIAQWFQKKMPTKKDLRDAVEKHPSQLPGDTAFTRGRPGNLDDPRSILGEILVSFPTCMT